MTDLRRTADSGSRSDGDSTERSPAAKLKESETSELVAKVAALEHELRLRDQFISTAAHELRNPLSPAYMQIEHMKEMVSSSAAPISHAWLLGQLAAVTTRFDRFLQTLNRILDASRLGDGHLVLIPEACDLVDVTKSVLAATELQLRAAQTPVELDAPTPVTGWWDRLRLEQIVSNLVSNAARYGAGRPISVAILATADTARLTVRDRGIGIPADDLPRIFQRFERAHNVGHSAGFGIGLWVVAQLCRAMHGTIEVESEPGRGTTFAVALPR